MLENHPFGKKLAFVVSLVVSAGTIITIICGGINSFYEKEINRYESEISSIQTKFLDDSKEKFFNINSILINKTESNKIPDYYQSLSDNIVYFNDTFVNNDWIYEKLTTEDYYKKYFLGKIPSHINKKTYNFPIHHWKSKSGSFMITDENNHKLYQRFESFITLQVISREELKKVIALNYKNNTELANNHVQYYINNYIYGNIADVFDGYIKLNGNDNSASNAEARLINNTLHIKNFITKENLDIFDEHIIISLKDHLVHINAKLVTDRGITNDNSYFIKWLNNLRIIKR
jgi:hypothetical protein